MNQESAVTKVEALSTYQPVMCELESVSDLTPVEKLFRIKMPGGQDLSHNPGQFVQVSIWGKGEAPISICSSPTKKGYFELGVRRTGSLTNAMHELKAGDKIGIRGPFGSYFDVEKLKGKDLLLICGGCGLAPMRSLIQYCEDRRDDFNRVTILYGARSPVDKLYKEDLKNWQKGDKLDCLVTVDRAPKDVEYTGKVGLITTLIPPLQLNVGRTVAVIVGPPIMYRFVITELKKRGIHEGQIIVSLERYMKCGVGKCGHCTIEHMYCCIEGPVFCLKDVSQLRGAV
ncbi:FAD/NAD(P)-binding protein [Candidatus Riflebacteria bacterium]